MADKKVCEEVKKDLMMARNEPELELELKLVAIKEKANYVGQALTLFSYGIVD